jgi:hypothetical protein
MAAATRGAQDAIVGTGDARAQGSNTSIEFTYIGHTALTAIGPVTGASYRFNQPGARVHVSRSDAASMAQIPVLRRT